jgi:hypothetical protein
MNFSRILGLPVLAILVSATGAGQTTFEAALDRTQVGLGEQFTLTFTLTGTSMSQGKNLQLPDLSKFHIMSGPNQSSSMQIINGSVSSSVT